MAYPQTGSTLYQSGSNITGNLNKTSTSLSTNIIIKVEGIPVGAIQRLSIDESRTIKQIPEVGTDGMIDSVPQSATTYTVTCERVRFDQLRIAQAFRRGFVHAQSQIYPFDIQIYDLQSENNAIITTIKNCWIERISYAYQAQDWTINETMNLKAETIYTQLSNGDPIINLKTARYVAPYTNANETGTDKGDRRGSLDAPGLIDLTGGY